MNHQMSSSSSTSAVPNPVLSSSAQVPPAQTVTASTLPAHPAVAAGPSGLDQFLEKWGVPLGGMLLTGVIGYFSALIMLKDSINENKTEISVAKKEIEHVKDDVKRMEGDVAKIPAMDTAIAVIRTKVDMTDSNARRK